MSRIEKLRKELATRELESALVTQMVNVRYLTGFSGSFGQAIVTPTQNVLVTDSRYTIQAGEQCKGWDVRSFQSPVKGIDFLKDTIAELGVGALAFEADFVTYDAWERWRGALNGVELKPVTNLVNKLRQVKDEDEIAALARACALTDACFSHILPKVQENVTEGDIALEIEFYFRRQGADIAFSSIVVSGERSARPHGTPSEKRLQRGDFVTMDFGGKLDGYSGDITRTVVIGEASEQHRHIYHAVLEAQMAAIEALAVGKPGAQIDQLSRDVLARHGLAQYFGHGLGHGLGLEVHDGLLLSQASDTVLEPGMVLTVEPGVYIEGFGGCRIEDDVVMRDSGPELLTKSDKSLMVV
jgi:Xaa-Pro aminopeptidase